MKTIAMCVACWFVLACFSITRGAETDEAKRDAAIASIAERALQAGQEQKWEVYIAQFHPEALQEFADLLRPTLAAAEAQGPEQAAALLPMFANAKSLASVLKLSPRDFFRSFMQGTTATYPTVASQIKVEVKVLGVVHEAPDLAHVVTRTRRSMANFKHTRMEVFTLKKSGDDWKLLLPDDLRTVAQSFQLSLRPGNVAEATAKDEPQPEK